MTLKSAASVLVHDIFGGMYQNFNLFPAKYGTFIMSNIDWVDIIKISIISQSSLMTLTRLILAGLLLIFFIEFSIKFTSQ